jgi:hypothetical protein
MVAGSAVQKFGANLDEHHLLMAASDMLIEIYMAESTILRTEKLAKNQGEKTKCRKVNGKIILVSSSRYRYSKRKAVISWKVMNNA